MVKLPYGISNFEDLVTQGYYYVDRTNYLEVFENLSTKYHFFLRPTPFWEEFMGFGIAILLWTRTCR